MSAVYNRVLAAGYATKYALHPNTAWIKDIEDCTNFVSQALYFGGWPMTAGDGSDGVTAWYNTSDPDSILGENWGRSSYRRSRTWGAAENFRQFLQFGGRARKCAIDQLTIGDVVQHSANGRASHSMMITGFAPSSPSSPETLGLKGSGAAGVVSLQRQVKYPSHPVQIAIREPFLEEFGPCARHLQSY
jgi:hypothetical protein